MRSVIRFKQIHGFQRNFAVIYRGQCESSKFVIGTEVTSFARHMHSAVSNSSAHHQTISGQDTRWRNANVITLIPIIECARTIHLSIQMRDKGVKSKVEVSVQALLDEKKSKEAAEKAVAKGTEKGVAVKKKLTVGLVIQKVKKEIIHYYHGFRLLFIDINVARKLIWLLLHGHTLSRRENKLLVRTSADIFRLLPFSVFLVVPFMELLLPLFIKFFPGMLPSTFQTTKDKKQKALQKLKMQVEMTKFLATTLDDMALKSSNHGHGSSASAKEFTEWFNNVRTTGEQVSNADIMKFSKLFEDEITLDSLSKPQLAALCKTLNMSSLGTTTILRFKLAMKLRSLAADDKMIQQEGIDTMTLAEIQSACRARGMTSIGLDEAQVRSQLQNWIHLSLDEKVPPSLLLLSRGLMIPENAPTSDMLKATISSLPANIVTKTKHSIGEREGKIENKTKIQLIQEEERQIMEERKEAQEAGGPTIKKEPKKRTFIKLKVDKRKTGPDEKPPLISTSSTDTTSILPTTDAPGNLFNAHDLKVIETALDAVKETKKLVVEKEKIKEIKHEIADYQEDVKELQQVMTTAEKAKLLKETKAAKRLLKRVNKMVTHIDSDMEEIESPEDAKLKSKKKKRSKSKQKETVPEPVTEQVEEFIRIDDLMNTIKKLPNVPDPSRLALIESILRKIDRNKNGMVKIEHVLNVIEIIGTENQQMDTEQIDELVQVLKKEEDLGMAKKKKPNAEASSVEVKGEKPKLDICTPVCSDEQRKKGTGQPPKCGPGGAAGSGSGSKTSPPDSSNGDIPNGGGGDTTMMCIMAQDIPRMTKDVATDIPRMTNDVVKDIPIDETIVASQCKKSPNIEILKP